MCNVDLLPCMDNSEISQYELLGRNITFPVSFNKNGNKVKARRFYPYNREDEDNHGFFTNKISLARLCKFTVDEMPSWKKHIEVAEKFNKKGTAHGGVVKFIKGFLVVRACDFDNQSFSIVAAANKENPFHMHVVINGYRVPFSPVESVGEILPEDVRYQLDMLQKKALFVEVDSESSVAVKYPSPCSVCDIV